MSKYSVKPKFVYPDKLRGAEPHWRGFTAHAREQQAARETPSARGWSGRYHRFVEEARTWRSN